MRAVIVVAQELNMSRAARLLSMSQPAVSRLVARVEREVGVPLFDRQGRTLRVTAAGMSVCPSLLRLVAAYDEAIGKAIATMDRERVRGDRTSGLRVGYLFPGAAELTRPILQAFAHTHPSVRTTVVDVSRMGGEQSLRSGVVDVAFLWSPLSSDVDSETMFRDRLVALLPVGRSTAAPTIETAELADEHYTVTTGMSDGWRRSSLLQPWAERPRNAVPVPSVNEAMFVVAMGKAVTIGPASLQRFAPQEGIRYVPVADAGRPRSVLCCRASDSRPSVREFLAVGRGVSRAVRSIAEGGAASDLSAGTV